MKESLSGRVFDNINVILMICLMTVTVYPFLYVTFGSISEPFRIMQHTGILLSPLGFSLNAYKAVFDNPNILLGYKNTLIYVIAGTSINIAMTSLGAYVLTRKRFKVRNILMFAIAFTMLFHGGLIPTYLVVKNLGLLNTRWAILIPRAMDAFNLIIMRTYISGMPDSLEESAKLDGANDLTVLMKIIIPLAKPVMAVMVLFYGVKNWNTWFNPMIYLRSRSLYPLQLILREILIENDTEGMMVGSAGGDMESLGVTIKYATIMVATVPILFIYPLLQKYFVQGVMIGAIKG